MRFATTACVVASWLTGSEALVAGLVGPTPQMRVAASSDLRRPLQTPVLRTVWPSMQLQIDESSSSFYDEYLQTDPATGEQKTISLGEKEKLYLECLDAYYNEGGKQLLSDDEYERLKLDLDFDGSVIATYSKDEIRFVLANKRYGMGKPTLSDDAYDALREQLRSAGSLVVLHDGASCNAETGICKSDLIVDSGKTRLLYLPGTAGGLILACEFLFWTLHIDPILSIILGSVPAYFFGVWFTENIFAQEPLVTTATCPECNYLQPVFFGDLFRVNADGLVGKAPASQSQLDVKCVNCKAALTADREKMLLLTTESKVKK
jgi:hypothetical protein